MDVRDHRDRREPDDLLQRLGILDLRHRAAHDLAAGRDERGDLRRRRLDVVRLRQRHRLDDDRCAATDRDVADADLRETAHPRSSVETCPSSPRPRTWTLARPPDDHPHDAWGLGADLEPGTLLAAYRAGLFPMRVEGDLVWWSPVRRAVIPVDGLHALPVAAAGRAWLRDPRRHGVRRRHPRLRRSRDGRTAGSTPASSPPTPACTSSAGPTPSRPGTTKGLAGGLYGVAIGGLFAAESMFHRRTGASKAALLGLDRAAPSGRRPAPARRPVGDAASRLARCGRDHAARSTTAGSRAPGTQ